MKTEEFTVAKTGKTVKMAIVLCPVTMDTMKINVKNDAVYETMQKTAPMTEMEVNIQITSSNYNGKKGKSVTII